jgi:uncharacterized membrane protein YhaH (DUF805 family)
VLWSFNLNEPHGGATVGTFSPTHFIVLLAVVFVIGFPMVRILQRTGHSGWWAILWMVPFVNLIALWIFAFAKWPAVDRAGPV